MKQLTARFDTTLKISPAIVAIHRRNIATRRPIYSQLVEIEPLTPVRLDALQAMRSTTTMSMTTMILACVWLSNWQSQLERSLAAAQCTAQIEAVTAIFIFLNKNLNRNQQKTKTLFLIFNKTKIILKEIIKDRE